MRPGREVPRMKKINLAAGGFEPPKDFIQRPFIEQTQGVFLPDSAVNMPSGTGIGYGCSYGVGQSSGDGGFNLRAAYNCARGDACGYGQLAGCGEDHPL